MWETKEIFKLAISCWAVNIILNLWYLLKLKKPAVLKLDAPLDLNKVFFDGQRVLGNSTTWVGLPIAITSGAILGFFLFTTAMGVVIGLLSYCGHAIGSFIKRRMQIPRGKYVPIIDHGDSIIITGAIFYILGWVSFNTAVCAILFTLMIQPILAYTGYILKLRDNPL